MRKIWSLEMSSLNPTCKEVPCSVSYFLISKFFRSPTPNWKSPVPFKKIGQCPHCPGQSPPSLLSKAAPTNYIGYSKLSGNDTVFIQKLPRHHRAGIFTGGLTHFAAGRLIQQPLCSIPGDKESNTRTFWLKHVLSVNSLNLLKKYSPNSRLFSVNPSRMITSKVANPAAHAYCYRQKWTV